MRILVTTTGSAGHLTPLIPFLDAIRAAGGEVLVASRVSALHRIRAAGYDAWPLAEAPDAERSAVFASSRGLPPAQANARALEVFAGLDAAAALPGLLDAIRDWRPDLILSEASEFAGRLVGAHHELPCVIVAITQYAVEHELRDATDAALTRLRDDHGLRARDDRAETRFTLLPPRLEHPAHPGPSGTHRFREHDAPTNGSVAAWFPPDEHPLVYLTFGTAAPQMGFFPGLYRAAIDALAPLPINLLATTGHDRDPADLGPLPANVRVERWLPQADVVRHVRAMVCHGGTGTVRGALAQGVPVAVRPMFADQPHNAERVAELGAGLVIEPGLAGLAEAVHALLADDRYTARAAEIAADIRALPTVDTAVDVLKKLIANDGLQPGPAGIHGLSR
ncbi:glycosyltransferase [Solirubrobacter taibaiensis]|nr:glycosyltransferase [Solirubrobacter taibaiensis]